MKSYDSNTYTYNANGIRTSKTVGGVKHDYILDGTKILREAWGSNTLIHLYDNEDSVCGILYNNVPYYVIKNLQGDVIAIVDKDAETVARYSYDAWGVPKIKSDISGCSIATINPFRYRGYYYDQEIELYYLQSRYYNPLLGRWVNSDEVIYILFSLEALQHNLFAYGANNSVNNIDYTGYWWFSIKTVVAGIILDAVISWLLPYVCTAFHATKLVKWAKFSRWSSGTYNSAVKKLAKAIYNGIDSIMYKLMGRAANAATRAFTLSRIQSWVEGILNFSLGYGIAWLIDCIDSDGKSGYIRF